MPVTFNPKTQKWVADYTDQFGNRHRHGFDTKKEAKAELTAREAEIQKRSFAASNIKLRPAAEEYISDLHRRCQHDELDDMTVSNYEANLRRYVLGDRDLKSAARPDLAGMRFGYPLGNLPLRDLKVAHIVELRAKVRDLGLSSATANAVVRSLSGMLSFCIVKGYITSNVVQSVRRRRTRADRKVEIVPPEKTAIAALISAAETLDESGAGLIIMFACLTGLRTSEQRALKWRAIDLRQGTVRVEHRLNMKMKLGEPKSEAGKRTIPLSERLVRALTEWKAATANAEPDDWVFPGPSGGPAYHSGWLERTYNPAWKRAIADWNGTEPVERCTWHYLRHFAISCWIEKDVPVKQVQKWAGHATASMTLDLYGHLFKSANHAITMDEVAGDIWSD